MSTLRYGLHLAVGAVLLVAAPRELRAATGDKTVGKIEDEDVKHTPTKEDPGKPDDDEVVMTTWPSAPPEKWDDATKNEPQKSVLENGKKKPNLKYLQYDAAWRLRDIADQLVAADPKGARKAAIAELNKYADQIAGDKRPPDDKVEAAKKGAKEAGKPTSQVARHVESVEVRSLAASIVRFSAALKDYGVPTADAESIKKIGKTLE